MGLTDIVFGFDVAMAVVLLGVALIVFTRKL